MLLCFPIKIFYHLRIVIISVRVDSENNSFFAKVTTFREKEILFTKMTFIVKNNKLNCFWRFSRAGRIGGRWTGPGDGGGRADRLTVNVFWFVVFDNLACFWIFPHPSLGCFCVLLLIIFLLLLIGGDGTARWFWRPDKSSSGKSNKLIFELVNFTRR